MTNYTPAAPSSLEIGIRSTSWQTWIYIVLVLVLSGVVGYYLYKNFIG